MSAISIVARKELRAYFDSPVALIFLGLFLLATLVSFFGTGSFFARNLADVRPLFEWLPSLLVLLVAAISMRQWAEEKKMGTLELLLTLPVRTADMVLGKFVAGCLLVAIALALTLPIPLMVSLLGDLDWGPVIGGYVGASLLGATYLSIGLCVSARTDNQVVALMLTLVIGFALVAIGSGPLTELFGQTAGELLRALGTGSRFASIERGVLDLRDLAYYAGLCAFFLVLNVHFLESGRLDHGGDTGRAHARRLLGLTALAAANVLLLNVWLAPVTALRLDLTEGDQYSIDRVTVDTLRALDEPLRIDAFFSERTHPLLSPLVPQIRDLLDEYAIAGDGRVQVTTADPNRDEALEQEIGERYGIRSVPFQVADRHQQAVVNSFFHLLVRYGDRHEVLSFDELIEVDYEDDELIVRLRNPEYDLTRTIQRVSRDFQNMESIFARLPNPLTLTLYATPSTLPESFAEGPARVREIAARLGESAGGKLRFVEVDPSTDEALAAQLLEQFGIRPLALDLFGQETFYFDLVLESDDEIQRISPRSEVSQAELDSAIEAAIRRASPGQLETIGLFTRTPPPTPRDPRMPPEMQPPQAERDFRAIEQIFSEDYRVRPLELASGEVPDDIDLLLLAKTGALDEREQYAIDQYLMRGGRVIALAGRFAIDLASGRLAVAPEESPLFDLLETFGVAVEPALVLDPRNASFPVPVEEQRGMFRVQRIEMLPYPFFPDVRRDGMAEGHPALAGLPNVTTPWASPLALSPPEGVTSEVLLRSSAGSWLDTTGTLEPDLQRFPGVGFGPQGEVGERILAATLTGTFPSHFADRRSPLAPGAEDGAAAETGGGDPSGLTLARSLPDARLVVIGSSEIASDLIVQLASRVGGEVHRANLQLLQNLIDWSLEDTGLLSIRSSGVFTRTLAPLTEAEARAYEIGCYVVSALLLLAVVWGARRLGRAAPLRPAAEVAA